MRKSIYLLFTIFTVLFTSCGHRQSASSLIIDSTTVYTNPIILKGADPWATFKDGKYYYTQTEYSNITLWATDDLTQLEEATKKVVWIPKDPSKAYSLWTPKMQWIDGKWYIYYCGDDGFMDNRQIYVLENESPDPMKGKFVMKGKVVTDAANNLAIHASSFEHRGKRYLIWSGWESKRVYQETQCIYIAEMKNPWTLASERVMISRPDQVWECQWISTDGSKSGYPVHVNEAPHFFRSKNGDKLLIYYSASANWTPFYCLGLLEADADSDPLRPESWKKRSEPVFRQSAENEVYGPGHISLVPSPNGEEWFMLYHVQPTCHDIFSSGFRHIYLQKMDWDAEGMPVLGVPQKAGTMLKKPAKVR